MGILVGGRNERHEDISIACASVELITAKDEVVIGGGCGVERPWGAVVVAAALY